MGSAISCRKAPGLRGRSPRRTRGRLDEAMSGPAATYTYDALGRLKTAYRWSGCSWGGVWPQDTISGPHTFCDLFSQVGETFAYDAMGNRTDNSGVPSTGNRYATFKSTNYYYD